MEERCISILVTDGETYKALKFLRCLGGGRGFKIQVQSKSPRARGRHSRYCSRFFCCRLTNVEEWLGFLYSVVPEENINLIVPVSERTIEVFSKNYRRLSEASKIVALPKWESLNITLNKWKFQRYIEKMGLPSIPSVLVGIAEEEECKERAINIERIRYPALLKPTTQEGGIGISKINNPGEFERVWNEKKLLFKGREYYLQSFIPGIDFCLQLYARSGEIIAYTIQRSLQVESGFYGPQRIMEFVENEKVLALSKHLIAALAWDGFACIDFRQDTRDESYRLLEVNPRIGQAIIGSMMKGVNLAEIGCRESLGMGLPAFKYEHGLYIHPMAYVKMAIQRLAHGKIQEDITWRNSGLRFVCNDPKPEVIDLLRNILKLHTKLKCIFKWRERIWNWFRIARIAGGMRAKGKRKHAGVF